jgi:hypothetical protein
MPCHSSEIRRSNPLSKMRIKNYLQQQKIDSAHLSIIFSHAQDYEKSKARKKRDVAFFI